MANILYGGRRRRRRGLHGRRRRRRGGSWLTNALSKAHNWIKSKKIISTVGNALGAVGVPYAGAIGKVAGTLGYGRRRRVRRRRLGGRRRVYRRRVTHRRVGGRRRVYRRRRTHRRRKGGNLKSLLSTAHKFIKDNRLISKGLRTFGHSKLAAASQALGYGRRRRAMGAGTMFASSQLAAPRFY